jgi:hypothetical protein
MSSNTPNYNLYLPELGDSTSNSKPWGRQFNNNLTIIDTELKKSETHRGAGVINAVSDFGLVATKKGDRTTAATNTLALNAAMVSAQATGRPLYIPSGWYAVNPLTTIVDSMTMYGDHGGYNSTLSKGTATILDFGNALGQDGQKCINVNPPADGLQQIKTFEIRDIVFFSDGVSGAPQYFIYKKIATNMKIRGCSFQGKVGTTGYPGYAIAHQSDYGLTIESCTFLYLYCEGAILFKHDGNLDGNTGSWSYGCSVTDCDISLGTYGKYGINIQGGVGYKVTRTVIEGTSDTGIKCNTTPTANLDYTWGLVLDTVYFEGNTNYHLDISSPHNASSQAIIYGGQMQGGNINLGASGTITIMGLTISSGICRIMGSANAAVKLINCAGFFIQNNTVLSANPVSTQWSPRDYSYRWNEDSHDVDYQEVECLPLSGGVDNVASTIQWHSVSGTKPDIGNGSLRGWYTRKGDLITLNLNLIPGTTTVWGDAAQGWIFIFPNFTAADTAVGNWVAEDYNTITYAGHFRAITNSNQFMLSIDNANSAVSASVPMTWNYNAGSVVAGVSFNGYIRGGDNILHVTSGTTPTVGQTVYATGLMKNVTIAGAATLAAGDTAAFSLTKLVPAGIGYNDTTQVSSPVAMTTNKPNPDNLSMQITYKVFKL